MQPSNALLPTLITSFGKINSVKLVQPENAYSSIIIVEEVFVFNFIKSFNKRYT